MNIKCYIIHMTQILYIKKRNNIDPLLLKTVHIRRSHNSSFVYG